MIRSKHERERRSVVSLVHNDQLKFARIEFLQPFNIVESLICAYRATYELKGLGDDGQDSLHIGSPTRSPLALLNLDPVSWSEHPPSRSLSLTRQVDTADQYQRSCPFSLIGDFWYERHEHCRLARACWR